MIKRTMILAAALLAPGAAFAHGQHPPAGPQTHGLWHLIATPTLGVLGAAACAALIMAVIGARRARRRRRAA